MTTPIVVTGGTGTLGRQVAPLLQEAGHTLRMLSRHGGLATRGVEQVKADLSTGQGLNPALAGVRTVLHLAGGAKGDDVMARNLIAAASRAGVDQIVYISVIAVDKMPLGWFRTQLRAEQAITNSGIPWTVLRAAQFHSAVFAIARAMTRLPVVLNPSGLRFQPVDERDVAARLVNLTLTRPAGRVPDLAGPKVYGLDQLVRSYLRTAGKRRSSLPIRIPGGAGRAYRAGANLNLTDAIHGTRSWEMYLTERMQHGSITAETGTPSTAYPEAG